MAGLSAVRLGWTLALLAVTACTRTSPAAPAVDPRRAASVLLLGASKRAPCQSDLDCAGDGQRSACVLAACQGLLTTDQRAARRTLVSRLEAAPVAVRDEAARLLATALTDGKTSPFEWSAAIEGSGACLRAARRDHGGRLPPSALQTVLGGLTDHSLASVATTARIELASAGDGQGLPALLEDLQTGTELLRVEAARGLGGLFQTPHAAAARDALVAALDDGSQLVQAAAVDALRPWHRDGTVRAALQRLVGPADGPRRAAHLAYTVERILGDAP